MPHNLTQELQTIAAEFEGKIAQAIQRQTITRDLAQQILAREFTGVWNRLDRVINNLPIRVKQERNGNGKR